VHCRLGYLQCKWLGYFGLIGANYNHSTLSISTAYLDGSRPGKFVHLIIETGSSRSTDDEHWVRERRGLKRHGLWRNLIPSSRSISRMEEFVKFGARALIDLIPTEYEGLYNMRRRQESGMREIHNRWRPNRTMWNAS
jgi:hypothetical protein